MKKQMRHVMLTGRRQRKNKKYYGKDGDENDDMDNEYNEKE